MKLKKLKNEKLKKNFNKKMKLFRKKNNKKSKNFL